MVVPHTVHDAPPGERIRWIGEPAGERRATVSLGVVRAEGEPALERLDERERAGPDLMRGREHVAPREHVDRPRHALADPGRDGVGHLHRRQFFLLLRRGRQISVHLLEFAGHGRIAVLGEQLLPFGLEGDKRAAGGGGAQAVDHVRSLPARRRFDRVERRHHRPRGHVLPGGVLHPHLGQRKDKVSLARGELRGGDPHVAALGGRSDHLRLDARIGHIGRRVVRDHRHARRKRRVVCHLHAIPHGKPEARADLVEVVVAGMDRDLRKIRLLAEVELEPLHGVGRRADCAVIPEPVGRVAVFELGSLCDLLIDLGQPRPRFRCDGRLELLLPLLQGGLSAVGGGVGLPHRGLGVIVPVLPVEGRKHGLERVVVVLRDRIELVVVALGALDRDARERADRVGHHVVAVEVPGDLAVGLRLGHLTVADLIPRAGGDEPNRLLAVGCVRMEHVARHLLLDELRIGLVGVERPDHVIAIGPGVGPGLVLVVAVRVAVVDDVEPVPRPALAVPGRDEQPFDELFVGLRVGVGDEGLHLVGRGRQADEIE